MKTTMSSNICAEIENSILDELEKIPAYRHAFFSGEHIEEGEYASDERKADTIKDMSLLLVHSDERDFWDAMDDFSKAIDVKYDMGVYGETLLYTESQMEYLGDNAFAGRTNCRELART